MDIVVGELIRTCQLGLNDNLPLLKNLKSKN